MTLNIRRALYCVFALWISCGASLAHAEEEEDDDADCSRIAATIQAGEMMCHDFKNAGACVLLAKEKQRSAELGCGGSRSVIGPARQPSHPNTGQQVISGDSNRTQPPAQRQQSQKQGSNSGGYVSTPISRGGAECVSCSNQIKSDTRQNGFYCQNRCSAAMEIRYCDERGSCSSSSLRPNESRWLAYVDRRGAQWEYQVRPRN